MTQEPREFPSYVSGSLKAQALQEVVKMLEKGKVIIQDRVSAFYSRSFMMGKTLSGRRPGRDLLPLNIIMVVFQIQKGGDGVRSDLHLEERDLIFSVDLKDALYLPTYKMHPHKRRTPILQGYFVEIFFLVCFIIHLLKIFYSDFVGKNV